jgi:hemerythrin-like domain-containing protein
MEEFLILLKNEHRQLLALAGEMEDLLPSASMDTVAAPTQMRVRQLLEQIIALLAVHGEKEGEALFPMLRARLPETDHWQIRMTEIQDEAIVVEARHLIDWCAGSAPPAARFREHGVRLARWLREHVLIEEERLFPRL